MNEQVKRKYIKIGGLWIKNGARGEFQSGQLELSKIKEVMDIESIDKINIAIFPNDYKKDNQPDFVINLSVPDEVQQPEPKRNEDDDFPF